MASERMQIDLLKDSNYGTWSVRMKAVLVSKGLWDAAKGKAGATPESVEKALAVITLGVSDPILAYLGECTTAAEAWTKLGNTFKGKNNARILQLRRDLTSLQKIPREPIVEYVARARAIMNDLIAAGHTIAESDVVWSILAGLSKPYHTIVEVLCNGDEKDLTIETVTAKLLIYEAKTELNESADARAYMAGAVVKDGGEKRVRKCWICGSTKHLRKDCDKADGKQAATAMFARIRSAKAF
jgi:hypothetical protein